MESDIRIVDIQTYKVPTRCRTPLKFGAVVVEELPIGYAHVTVENRAGDRADGWGAMFLMDLWAWPVSHASHDAKNRAMCDLLDAYAQLVAGYGEYAHPIELFMETEERTAPPEPRGLRTPHARRGDALPGRTDLRQPGGPRRTRRLWPRQRH